MTETDEDLLCEWVLDWKAGELCAEPKATRSWKFCYQHYLSYAHKAGFSPLPNPAGRSSQQDLDDADVQYELIRRRERELAAEEQRKQLEAATAERRKQLDVEKERRRVEREAQLLHNEHRGVVYYMAFIEHDVPVIKIGMTLSHVSVRYHDIVKSMRRPMTPCGVLAHEVGYALRERERHEQFAADRVHGEYFRASPPLLEHVGMIMSRSGFDGEGVDIARTLAWIDRFDPRLREPLIGGILAVRRRRSDELAAHL